MAAKLVRIEHGRASHCVALFAGLEPDELSRLLKAVYSLDRFVVGLQDSASGMVVPISLACRSPDVLGDATYSLLQSDRELLHMPPPPTAAAAAATAIPLSAPNGPWAGAAAAEARFRGGGADDDDEEEEDGDVEGEGAEAGDADGGDGDGAGMLDGADADVGKKVLACAWYLASQGVLTAPERRSIADLVDEGDRAVLTAHAVASADGDGRYLAALLRDVARNAATARGKAVLQAQRELLDVVAVLSEPEGSRALEADQRAFLEKLVMVRSDLVMAAYQAYQADGDIEELMDSLLLVARNVGPGSAMAGWADAGFGNTAAAAAAAMAADVAALSTAADDGGEEGGDAGEEDDEEDEEGEEDDATDDGGGGEGMQTLAEVAAAADAAAARERAALAAVVKEAAAAGVQRLKTLQPEDAILVERMAAAGDEVVAGAVEVFRGDGDLEELVDTLARCAKIARRRQQQAAVRASASASPRCPDGRDASPRQSPGAALAGPAGLGSVPAPLLRVVQVALRASAMTLEQARAVCGAFSAESREGEGAEGIGARAAELPRLVRSAWEVFRREGDDHALLDMLVRAVGNEWAILAAEASDAAGSYAPGERPLEVADAIMRVVGQCADVLVDGGRLSRKEAEMLLQPSVRGRQVIFAALENYEAERSLEDLLDTLHVLAKKESELRLRGPGTASPATHMPRPPPAGTAAAAAEAAGVAAAGVAGAAAAAAANASAAAGYSGARQNGSATGEKEDADAEGQGLPPVLSAAAMQLELLELVELLLRRDRVQPSEARALAMAITGGDRAVAAAHAVYLETSDVGRLVVDLLAVVEQPGTGGGGGGGDGSGRDDDTDAAGTGRGGEEAGLGGEQTGDEEDGGGGDVAEEGDRTLPLAARKHVLGLMVDTGVLDSTERRILAALVEASDARSMAAFDVYENTGEVTDLVDTLRRIVVLASEGGGGPIATAAAAAAATAGDGDGSDGGEDEDEGDAEDEEDEERDEHGTIGDVEAEFLRIVRGMQLGELETAALRLCLERGDAGIVAALEAFRVGKDADDLVDTLRRIARITISRAEEAASAAAAPGDAAAAVAIAEPTMNGGGGSGDGGNAGAAAGEGEVAGGLDLVEKEELFAMLLHATTDSGVLTEAQASWLERLYRERNDVLLAALEVYAEEEDMNDLVDTLQRVAAVSPA